MAGQIHTSFSDADIDSCINRIEAIIDCSIKVGTGGSSAFAWTTSTVAHWIVEGAATYGAALQLCGPSAASWNTLDQLVNAQNTFSFIYKLFMDIIQSDEFGDFIIEQ